LKNKLESHGSITTKPNLIILYPYRFRTFDRTRFEISCLKKKFNVVIFELIEYLHPHFQKAYMTRDESEDIERIADFKKFATKMSTFTDIDQTFIINFVPVTNFKELRVNNLLKKTKFIAINFNNPGVPRVIDTNNLVLKFIFKIKDIINRFTLNLLKNLFIEFLTRIINRLIISKTKKYIIVAGIEYETGQKYEIPGNSFDYNTYLNLTNISSFQSKDKYIVFLDTGHPYFNTDSKLRGSKNMVSVEKWYPALNLFFDKVEKLFSAEIKILAHPKHKYSNNDRFRTFKNREIIHGSSPELIAGSSLVFATNSTAVSFAILYKKPLCFLKSIEYEKSSSMDRYINSSSKLLGSPIINIDEDTELYSKEFFLNVDKNLYDKYSKKFLTSRGDKKTLCQIISEDIIRN